MARDLSANCEVAGHVVGVELADLLDDLGFDAGVVEDAAVGEDDAVEGRDRDDLDVVLGLACRRARRARR